MRQPQPLKYTSHVFPSLILQVVSSSPRASESLPFSYSSYADLEVTEYYVHINNTPVVDVIVKCLHFQVASTIFQKILQSKLSPCSKDPFLKDPPFD